MPVSPQTILFAIRALVRIGTAAQKEIEAGIRSGEFKIPKVLQIEGTPANHIVTAISATRYHNDPEFEKILDDLRTGTSGAETALFEFAAEIGLSTNIETAQEHQGLLTIKQWHEDTKRNVPMARLGLAIVEVALEYVAVNPAILGIGSNGERFVTALANVINDILLDVDSENITSAESLFTERSLAIAMHAGLGALQEYATENIGEDHLRDIATSVIAPLHDHYKNQRDGEATGKISRKSLIELREVMLGPMFQSGINALARNQQAVLGDRFKPSGALGAATEAILQELGQDDVKLRDVATRDSWLRIYDSLLDLAIARPELLAGQSADSAFGRDLVKTIASEMKTMKPGFSTNLATVIAVESVGVLSRHTSILFEGTQPWQNVKKDTAASILGSVHAGLKDGLGTGTGAAGRTVNAEVVLSRVFTEKQFGDLVRIVLDEAAKSPAMITGDGVRDEVKTLFAGIARSVSASERNLLSGEDWLHVGAVIAQEAARNPGKLFKMDNTGIEDQFAVKLVKDLLNAAAADFTAVGRDGGSVMFGDTLRTVMDETLRAASENVVKAATNQQHLLAFIGQLNALHPGDIGRHAWLRMYRKYYKTVLFAADGPQALANITNDDLLKLIGADN